jgi:hypothetical protein
VQWASELVGDQAAALRLRHEVHEISAQVGEPAPESIFAELLRLAERDRLGLDWWVGRYRRAVDGVREAHLIARGRGVPCQLRRPAAVAWHRCRLGWIGSADEDRSEASSTPAPAAPDPRLRPIAPPPEPEHRAVADGPLSRREGTIRMQLELAERAGHQQLATRLREQLAEVHVRSGGLAFYRRPDGGRGDD